MPAFSRASLLLVLLAISVARGSVMENLEDLYNVLWRTYTHTEKEPLRASWETPEVVVAEGEAAELILRLTGDKQPPYNVVFNRNGRFFQRITTEDMRVRLETTEPGNYTVQHIWRSRHFKIQRPGEHVYDDEVEPVLEPHACCALVRLHRSPTLQVIQADPVCGLNVSVVVSGMSPLRLGMSRAGSCSNDYELLHFEGEETTVTLPVDQAGTWHVRVSDEAETVETSKVIQVHDAPAASMLIRGNSRVCQNEWGHLEVNLTMGTPPWTATLERQVGRGDDAQVTMVPIGPIVSRLHIAEIRESGKYRLIKVEDAFCANSDPTEQVEIEILPAVSAVVHAGVDEACEGTVRHLPHTFEGVEPFFATLQLNGVYHRRQTVNFTTPLLVERPGVYSIGEVTDFNYCLADGVGTHTVVRWPLPHILIQEPELCAGTVQYFQLTGVPPFVVNFTVAPLAADKPKARQVTLCGEAGGPKASHGNYTCPLQTDQGDAGKYDVASITDSRGCTAFRAVRTAQSFVVFPRISASLDETQRTSDLCPGDSLSLFATRRTPPGGPWTATFAHDEGDGNPPTRWEVKSDDDKAKASVRHAGAYTLVGVSDQRCGAGNVIGNGRVNLGLLSAPTAKLVASTGPGDCLGTEVMLALSGTAPWKVKLALDGKPDLEVNTANANHTVKVTSSGRYTIASVRDAHNCRGETNKKGLDVELASRSVVKWSKSKTVPLCEGDEAELAMSLTGVGPWVLIILLDGRLFARETVPKSPLSLKTKQPGKYTISSLLDAKGCPGKVPSDPVTVQHRTRPSVSLKSVTVCAGKALRLSLKGSPTFTLAIRHLGNATRSAQTVTAASSSLTIPVGGNKWPPGPYTVESVKDRYCVADVGVNFHVHPMPHVDLHRTSDKHLAWREGTALLATLTVGSPPWEADLVSDANDAHKLHITAHTRELTLDNHAGEREWVVDQVWDENGCTTRYEVDRPYPIEDEGSGHETVDIRRQDGLGDTDTRVATPIPALSN